MNNFEVTCIREAIEEASRRAKTKSDKLDVIDVQTSVNCFFEVLSELSQAKAMELLAKSSSNAERRKKRARS